MNPAVTKVGAAAPGMAAMGKTAVVLLAVVGFILLCAWLLKRFGLEGGQGSGNPALKVIASKALGSKERVVVLELEDTWLVLGIGAGRIDKLCERPAPPRPATTANTPTTGDADSFSARFAQALKHNLKHRGQDS